MYILLYLKFSRKLNFQMKKMTNLLQNVLNLLTGLGSNGEGTRVGWLACSKCSIFPPIFVVIRLSFKTLLTFSFIGLFSKKILNPPPPVENIYIFQGDRVKVVRIPEFEEKTWISRGSMQKMENSRGHDKIYWILRG